MSFTNNPQGALPSQLGVRPTSELATRFLSQSFGWMFAGLLLTAAIAFVVQGQDSISSAPCARSGSSSSFGQLGLGIAIQGLLAADVGDARARPVLRLRGDDGDHGRRDHLGLPGQIRGDVVPRGIGDVRRCRRLRRHDQAQPDLAGRVPLHGDDRAARRLDRQHRSSAAARSAGRSP